MSCCNSPCCSKTSTPSMASARPRWLTATTTSPFWPPPVAAPRDASSRTWPRPTPAPASLPRPVRFLHHRLQGLQVLPLRVALGGGEVAAFAVFVPGVDQHDAVGRGLVGVLLHPGEALAEGGHELLRGAVGVVPAGLLAAP